MSNNISSARTRMSYLPSIHPSAAPTTPLYQRKIQEVTRPLKSLVFATSCTRTRNVQKKVAELFNSYIFDKVLVIFTEACWYCMHITYWVTQKLPQICTVILCIFIWKVAWFAVYICGTTIEWPSKVTWSVQTNIPSTRMLAVKMAPNR